MNDKCTWKLVDDDYNIWETECVTDFDLYNEFNLATGSPKSNGFKFCPYCGKEISEIRTERV